MRKTQPVFLAAALLGACGSVEISETAEETPQQPAEAIDYIQDIGLIEEPLNTTLRERLAAFHAESGYEVHIVVILTTDNEDIEEHGAGIIEERGIGADGALILIALADENVAIVPASGAADALTPEFTDTAEAEMAEQFDARRIVAGLTGAVDAVTERLVE